MIQVGLAVVGMMAEIVVLEESHEDGVQDTNFQGSMPHRADPTEMNRANANASLQVLQYLHRLDRWRGTSGRISGIFSGRNLHFYTGTQSSSSIPILSMPFPFII